LNALRNLPMTEEQRDRSGKIFQTLKDGIPILWTLVPEIPPEDVRSTLNWLVVISWKYDGSSRNGMPQEDVSSQMLKFEDALTTLERPNFCFEAYRRIGNHLREFVLYIADRDNFMAAFNEQLAEHPRYPIDIKFYEDESWSELRELIDDLGPSSGVETSI
jgi:hypothetical protein